MNDSKFSLTSFSDVSAVFVWTACFLCLEKRNPCDFVILLSDIWPSWIDRLVRELTQDSGCWRVLDLYICAPMRDCALMSLNDRFSNSVHFMLTSESMESITGTGTLPLFSSMESHLLPISFKGTPFWNHLFLSSNRFACSRSQPSSSSLWMAGDKCLSRSPDATLSRSPWWKLQTVGVQAEGS